MFHNIMSETNFPAPSNKLVYPSPIVIMHEEPPTPYTPLNTS